MLPSGSIGGPERSRRYSALHRRDNSKYVCRGCYFYTEMPDPIPSAHSFLRLRLFPRPSFPPIPSHPARPIQLIFSQSKYESTKKSIYHASGSSPPFFLSRGNEPVYVCAVFIAQNPPRAPAASFCLAPVPRKDVVLSLCCQGADTLPHAGVRVCAGDPTCCAHAHMRGPLVIPRAAAHRGLSLCVFTAPWACCLLTTRKD